MSITCRLTIITLCFCAFLLHPLLVSSAELRIAPIKVYESILTNFKEKKYKNVKTALTFIEPIISDINTRFGIDLNPELTTRDERCYAAIKRLLFYDIQRIFAIISMKEEKDNPRVLFKMAYADYCLLSLEFLSDEAYFAVDKKIRKMFAKTYLDLGKESPYGKKIHPDINMFKLHAEEIVGELSKVVL
ncbi:MAG: hypothetical protein QME49_06480 [bacterium]|nr:hypothetical protein [bacterium]